MRTRLRGFLERLPITPPEAAALLLVVVAALVAGSVYVKYVRPAPPPEIRTLDSIGSSSASGAAIPAAEQAPDAAASAPPPATPLPLPATSELLRPGSELLSRFDLPGSAGGAGPVAISSRYTATSGCESTRVDVFTPDGARWRRLFAADDPSLPFGPLLPDASGDAGHCFPRLTLFAPQQDAESSGVFLLLAAEYDDSSLRLMVLGTEADGQVAVLYDWRTGPNGRLDRSVSGDRLDLSEDATALLADGSTEVLGRLVQTLTLRNGAAEVTGRSLAPACDRVKLVAFDGTAGQGPLIGTCSSGDQLVAGIDNDTALAPAGVSWTDVKAGDTLQLVYDPVSLEPSDFSHALPLATRVTDTAGGQTDPARTKRNALGTSGRGRKQRGAASRSATPRAGGRG